MQNIIIFINFKSNVVVYPQTMHIIDNAIPYYIIS